MWAEPPGPDHASRPTPAQPHAEAPVDARRDERAAGQPQEFVEAPVQLARAAEQARGSYVIGLAAQDWFDETGNVADQVRAVGIEEHRHVAADMWNRGPDRITLTAPAIGQHVGTATAGDRVRLVDGMAVNHDDLLRETTCVRNHVADRGCFILGSDDDREVRVHRVVSASVDNG